MAYPDRGLPKAAMGHYLTESARTALEAMEPEEGVVQLGPGKQMPVVGPNQLLDMPLFSKTPFLPGSNTLFYTTKLGEKLYQPSPMFDLNDPYCKIMAPKYNSLHDPHLRAFYMRKDNLKRLKKSGFVTDKNKVVCSLKEFNEYRQYLTSLKLEFEKHYIKEQKMIEKQVTDIQDSQLLPEAADTSKYRDWLLKEERPTIEEQENVMRNRYLEMINEELRKLEQLAEENRHLVMAQDDKKKKGLEKKKQILLRKRMEEEWRKKEMMLLMKIGDDIKREAKIEEQRQKSKEEKLKRKQLILEKKMAYHLKKLQARFLKEGFLPPVEIFATQANSEQVREDIKKSDSSYERLPEGAKPQVLEQSSSEIVNKDVKLPKAGSHWLSSRVLLAKGQGSTLQSVASLKHQPSTKTIPSLSKESLEEPVLYDSDPSRKESLESESVQESIPHTANSKVSYVSAKEIVSIASVGGSNTQATESVSGSSSRVFPSASVNCVSNEGAAAACGITGCGSKTSCSGSAGCGSKTSCSGSAGCGSKTSCCGSAGCGSKTSCCGSGGCGSKTCDGPAGCGSKTSCSGSAGCGSKTSCSGSAGCGSKTSCCGSAGCGSKTSCCGSGGCGSKTCDGPAGCGSKTSCSGSAGCCGNKDKSSCSASAGCCCNGGKSASCGSCGCGSSSGKDKPSYDSSGSSRPGASCGTSKCPFSSMGGGNPSYGNTMKSSTKTTRSSCKTASDGYGKTKKKKKREMFGGEPEGHPKERRSSKKRRTEKSKTEHTASNEGLESSYSSYARYLLSHVDQSEIRNHLKGKVSASELNSIIQNVMTWVVSAVTTILYPALTKFEERVRTRVYTVSEESVPSSDNSSSCSTCTEELCEIYGSPPCSSTRKVSFTDTSIKPTTSPSEFQTTSGKHTSLLSSNTTSYSKRTHTARDSDHFKRKFKRGKTAILTSPSRYSELLSTMTSVKSSKSDSHISQFQKYSIHPPWTANTSYHSKCRHVVPAILKTKGVLPKADNATKSRGRPFGDGEQKPHDAHAGPKGAMAFKDLRSIFAELKSYLTQTAAILLEDVFKQILGDLGFTTSSLSITTEVLLESISESLLGSQPADTSPGGSVSRIASFMANDIVENVLEKLQSAAQRTYLDILSKNDFAAGCKATCLVVSGKDTVPDPTFWRARIPLSFESVYGIAEEIVEIIREKLKMFSTSSQTKLYQFELCAKIKDIGKPLEQFYATVPPHTVESEAASLIVKETIRKIVSQTVASSETNVLQYVEEMISCILNFIQRQMSHEGSLPTRESSILLQLINDVFNSLSTEKLKGFSPPVKSRASPEMQGCLPGQQARPAVTTTTLYAAEKEMRKPFPPVNVPGMVIDAEVEGRGSTEPERTFSSGAKDPNVLVTTAAQSKITYERFNLESRQRSQGSANQAPESGGVFLEEGGKAKTIELEKTENNSDIFVQDAMFGSLESEQRVQFPAEEIPDVGQPTKSSSWTLYQALKKMEDEFKDREQPLLLEMVRTLLDDIFQHIWAAWPIWPPAPPPPSLAQLNIQQQPEEEQPASKRQIQVNGQTPISDSDVNNFTGDLVKTLFQKLSCATLADAESPSSRQPSLIITDILPLKEAADGGKGLPVVHFMDPGMSSEVETPKGGLESTTEDLSKTMGSPPPKLSLANHLVETILAKLEAFVTSKVEFQFCSDVHNLKTSTSSDFSSNLDQDVRKLLDTQFASLPTNIKDMLCFVDRSVLEVKEKAEDMPLSLNLDLKTYAQDVSRAILQSLKRGLDKEMETIATPPIIFSESIAASQILNMVFAVFSPQEHRSEPQDPAEQEECILEKLLGKNSNYKRGLHTQIQNTVESILNEIYQTIMFNVSKFPSSSCSPEKFRTCGMGEFLVPKTVSDTTPQTLSRSAIAKCEVSVVSDALVDIVLEDLCPALAAGVSSKGPLSDRLQLLVYHLVQKTDGPLSQVSNREVKVGLGDHLVDFEKGTHRIPGCSEAENVLDGKRIQFATEKVSDLKEVSPEDTVKSLVDNVALRLASFAEEKVASELMLVAQREEQSVTEGRFSAETPSVALFPQETADIHVPTPWGSRKNEAGSPYQKGKLMVHDLQTNLRLCAEKVTCTILQLIKKDLEGETLSSRNTVPHTENASAHERVNELLTILSVQIALTENEVHKKVLKQIFRRHPSGQRVTFPLLVRVEEVLNQIIQRIMGDLGHLSSSSNDSIFPRWESKSSAYRGVMETASQVGAGSAASEIVDSVLHKMYSVIMDTLFSSSESEVDRSSSSPLLSEDSHLMGASDTKKMASALSNLRPQLQSLSEELVQSTLNKISCFITANLEEILPASAQQEWKPHWTFQRDMQAGDGAVHRPRTFPEDSGSSLTSLSLSKSDLTVYAKDIVSKVLGTIMDEFRLEDFHRTILQIRTLSSDQISIAIDLLYSVVQGLHRDEVHLCHFHKDPTLRHFQLDGLSSSEVNFHLESPRAKCNFHGGFKSCLEDVLPKEGILKRIFEQQPLTDASIRENLKMLQGVENIVREVFMRIQDLGPSVCLLKRSPGELSEKLFCYNFKRIDTPGLPHSGSQAEIDSVARDILANVFENVQKCLLHSTPCIPEQVIVLARKGQALPKGSARIAKHQFTQPKLPFCKVSLKASMDAIDRMAKDTMECVVLTLETFVARHFRREFKCNFMEIVKFPLESLSFAQATRSVHCLSTQVGNGTETFGNETPGTAIRRSLSTPGPVCNFLDISKLGSTITKEWIEAAFREVQMLHSELSVYANNAVSSILETIKWILDKQLSQKEATLFSSSSESLALSETISVMLDRCTESLTEITSELMVENLQLEMSGQGLARDKTTSQNPVVFPGVKRTSPRHRRIDLSDSCPPIKTPAKVVHLEEDKIKEEIPSEHPSKLQFSELDIHTTTEGHKGLTCTLAARTRTTRCHGLDKLPNKLKVGSLEDDWLPRQRSIPKGSILEKLFNKIEESEAISRVAGRGNEEGPVRCEPLPSCQPLMVPESTCYPAICPLKLTQTANMIVNTILSEFGLENEPVVQASCVEKFRPLSPLKEKPSIGASLSSVFGEAKPEKQTVFSRWEKRLNTSNEKTNTWTEESSLLMQDESSLLSKWENMQLLSKSPERHKELELLACAHMPHPCEIQMLADHIVLYVIKELIKLTTQEPLEEKDNGTSALPWKQRLRERIWRSTYLPSSRHISSCLDLFWEPLTKAVISNILSSISNVRPRQNTPEGKGNVERAVSMFCSVDSYCPEHGLTGSKTPLLNIEDLATQVSEVIMGVLCERNLLQEPLKWKDLSMSKPKYIYVPPLCLADFDDVYHPLVKEVANFLSLEIERRSKYGTDGNSRDVFSHHHFSPSRFSRKSQTDDKDPSDVRGTMCLPTVGLIPNKKQRLCCVASNLDRFIHNLKNEKSKDTVNKVLHIIFDSLQPAQAQGSFSGHFSDAHPQDMMPYQDAQLLAKQHFFCSSICPHALRPTDSIASRNLGLSPKSILLLDVVSEKLIRALLEKCLTTDKFTQTFAFDEFPEDEQIYDVGRRESDNAVVLHSRRGMEAHQTDSTSSMLTYEIKYSEEPWAEAESGASSYESALDILAHTLVKPVLTELSLSIEQPRRINAFSRKTAGFRHPALRKPHVRHVRYGRNEPYSSMPRGRRLESRMPIPGRHLTHKNVRERNKSLLESTPHRRRFDSRLATPTGKPCARKPFCASCIKTSYRRDLGHVRSHPDPRQFQREFSIIYSATFFEEVLSQLLVRIHTSLRTKYDRVSYTDVQEMNMLFVNALVGEFKKAGVGLLPKTGQKTYLPLVDNRTINRLVDSILREFGFQLAADKGIVRDIGTMAEQAAEIILVEILDYQLPPSVCRRLPKSAYRNVKAERVIHRIEECINFSRAPKQKQPPPAYITILSHKYLERVINQLVAQFLPCSDSTGQKQDKWEMSQTDYDDICSYMVDQVMKSIAKHKIWVAKKDDQCHLHSEKEIQSMVDSVYTNMLKKSGSQSSIQKDVKCRSTSLVDSITSFIIQEISHHHLQTFLSNNQGPYTSPDTEALSKNIVKTVLDSVFKPSVYSAGVFPAKHLEEIVNRVLSKLFHGSVDKMEVDKVSHEVNVGEIAKRLANAISLQFGKSTVTGPRKGGEQSLVAPLKDVMDDMVDSVCHNIAREQARVLCDVLGSPRDDTAFETIKSWIEKGISDYLLHPLFSGDLLKGSVSSPVGKDITENAGEESGEIQNENRSPFNTFLSSGFLKDITTGLLSKIFPSTSSRDDAFPQDERHPLDPDIRKLSAQLLDDIRMNLLKHRIRVIKDTHSEQTEFFEEDIKNMTDSLSHKILQKAGSLEAIQEDMKNKSNSLVEQVAGFLLGDILKQHVQPFVSQPVSPAWDTATTGDSTSRLNIYRTVVKPLDQRQATQEMRDGSSPSVLREIIYGLFSRISGTLSDNPLSDCREGLGDTPWSLSKSLTQKLTTAQFSSQEAPEEKPGFFPEGRTSAGKMSLYKDRQGLPYAEEGGHTLPHHMNTSSFEEAAGYQPSSGRPSDLSEMKCFIQKNLSVGQADSKAKLPEPYITVISYQILEAIIDRLLCLIFPSSSSTSLCSAQEEGPCEPDFYNRIAQIKKDIMAALLIQAIWISSYGNEREMRVSEEAMKNMVETVYLDLLHEILFQQPLPQDRESLSNFYVNKIACFIMNEMFKYHLQSLAAGEVSPSLGYHLTVFPRSLLEVMLTQLVEKIFTAPDSTGKQTDLSDANITEIAANLKNCVITEISAHEIRLENTPERIPDMDQETEEDIANSVYNQILQKLESQRELQNSLLSQGSAVVLRAASVLTREILNYHLCPFLSGSDSSKSSCPEWQEKMELRPHDIYAAAFLEDIIVAFFCQILSSPNFRAYAKDSHLSQEKMRDSIIEQVNALVFALQLSNIKVIHCSEECSYFPQVTAEKVVQISNTIYQKLIEKSGSELEIFEAFRNKSHSLAEQLIPLTIKEVSGYHFRPLLSGDTSPFLFSFLQADAILDRVGMILSDSISSTTDLEEKFLKIIHRIFPSWASSDSNVIEEPDSPLGRLDKTTYFTEHTKEDPVSKAPRTEDGDGVHSSDFWKDIFHGLINKMLSSTTNTYVPEEKGADPEALLKYFVESVFKEFAKSPVKVLPVSQEQRAFPAVREKLIQVWQHEEEEAEELDSEGRGALEGMVDSVCAGFLRHSSSEASLYDDLMSQNEEVVDRLACYMVRAVSRGDFEPGSESEDDLPYSTTAIKLGSDMIIQKFLSDMDLMEQEGEFSDTQVPVVSVLFLEEILSRFLTKILLARQDIASPDQKTLSKAEVNDIAGQLKTSVESQMSKNKINLVSEDQACLPPEYEETVNQVVHSVFSNVLEKSGSQQELYNDMRNTKVIFPEQVASIIVDEISSYGTSSQFNENTENKTRSALELDRIVGKVIDRMSHQADPDEELSIDMMMNLPELEEEPLEDALLNSEEIPVKIVPYLGDKPLNVDPDLIADHLAVLSIKTEPLEKLNKRCLSRTGVSLTELRKASLSSKSILRNMEDPNERKKKKENKKKERRSSLDFAGHLDVRPREVVCRNSFQSLMKPNITKVELLKDVTSQEDLLTRLLAHDIDDQALDTPDREFKSSESEMEEAEKVLKAENSLFSDVPPVTPAEHKGKPPKKTARVSVLPKTSSSFSRKRSLSLSKCCPALSLSSSTTDAAIPKKSKSPPENLPQIGIKAMPSGMAPRPDPSGSDTAQRKVAAVSTSVLEVSKSVAGAAPITDGPPASNIEEEPEEEALEKAVVGMHLFRDTEETPGVLEITSVYQDKNIHESLSEEEEEESRAVTWSNPEATVLPRQQSSKFEKLSSALSRVFSRTLASNVNNTAEAPEKPTGDKA